jgi:hypothetical protein
MVVMAFQNSRIGFDQRLMSAIALLLEPGGLGPTFHFHSMSTSTI